MRPGGGGQQDRHNNKKLNFIATSSTQNEASQ
jgi:hypothetical protein